MNMFRSQNKFVIQAVNDYYDRCVAMRNDPYLETREKEDAFAERIVEAVEKKVMSNFPALEQNGNKPELFGDIVRAAVALLERLIAKVMQKVTQIAEKVIGKAVDIKETPREMPKESESYIQEKNGQTVSPERKKIPFPFDYYRKVETRNKVEQPQQKSTATTSKSAIKQMDAEQKSIPAEIKRSETERPPEPQPSVLAAKYQHLSSIVREYKFDSVQAFSKELNASKREYFDYKAARIEWEKIYGEKAADSMSIRDRLRQKEQIVKEREIDRVHQARQRDKGAR